MTHIHSANVPPFITVSGWVGIPVVAAAAVALVVLSKWASRQAAARQDGNSVLRHHLYYQPTSAAVALVTLLVLAVVAREPTDYWHLGDLNRPAHGLRLLAVGPDESWLRVGYSFAVIATVVTAVVVWLQVERAHRPVVRDLPLALLVALPISAWNAAVEEAIFRVGVGATLGAVASAGTVALLSGVLFGLPHWFGNPGRFPGVVLAGFLGWLMCQSMMQTGGIAWAWAIHTLQDVAILTILFASARRQRATSRSHRSPDPGPAG